MINRALKFLVVVPSLLAFVNPVLADDSDRAKRIEELKSQRVRFPDYTRGRKMPQMTDGSSFSRKVNVRGALLRSNDNQQKMIMKNRAALIIDSDPSLSKEDKLEAIQTADVVIDEVFERARKSGKIYNSSQFVDDVTDVASALDPSKLVPGDGKVAKVVRFGSRGFKIGVDVVAKVVKAGNHLFSSGMEHVNGDNKRGEIRAEAQAEIDLITAEVPGGLESVYALQVEMCRTPESCVASAYIWNGNLDGALPWDSAEKTLSANPNLATSMALEIDHELGVDSLGQAIGAAGQHVKDEIAKTNANFEKKIADAEARLAALINENSDAARAEIVKLRDDIEKYRKQQRKAINDLQTKLTDLINTNKEAVISTLTKVLGTKIESMHTDVVAAIANLRKKSPEELAAEERQRRKEEYEESFRTNSQWVDNVGTVAMMLAKKESTKQVVRAMQGFASAQLKIIHSAKTFQLAFEAAGNKFTGAALSSLGAGWFGVALSLSSLLGPSADAQLMKQIEMLRKEMQAAREEIQELRKEMHERIDELSDDVAFNFSITFARLDELMDVIGDMTLSLEELKAKVDAVLAKQADLRNDLLNVEHRLGGMMVSVDNRERMEQFNNILEAIAAKDIQDSEFREFYMLAYTNSEDISRMDWNIGNCTPSYEGAATCPAARLSEDFLWRYLKENDFGFDVGDFNFPNVRYWTPWTTLFSNVLIESQATIRAKQPELAKSLNEKIDRVSATTRTQRRILEAIRSPKLADNGMTTFPVFEKILADYKTNMAKLRTLARNVNPKKEVSENEKSVAPRLSPTEKITVVSPFKTTKIEVPNEILISFAPKELIDYVKELDERSKTIPGFQPGHSRLSWSVEFSWVNLETKSYTKEEAIPYCTRSASEHGKLLNWGDRPPVPRRCRHNIHFYEFDWTAKTKIEEQTAVPAVTLKGYVHLSNQSAPTLVVHRAFRSPTRLIVERSVTLDKPPFVVRNRAKTKKLQKEGDEVDRYLERQEPEYLDLYQRVLQEAGPKGKGSYKDFWTAVLKSKTKSWQEGKVTEEAQKLIQQEIAILQGYSAEQLANEHLNIIKHSALLQEYIPKQFEGSEAHFNSIRNTVRELCGIERVLGDMLTFALPEYYRNLNSTEQLNALFGMERLARLTMILDLAEGSEAPIEQSLRGLAKEFDEDKKKIALDTDYKPIELLLGKARSAVNGK